MEKRIILPSDLTPCDSTTIAIPYGSNNGYVTVQKYRDVLMKASMMTANGIHYVIFGAENQSEVHYAMVVRNILYDALQYTEQADAISRYYHNREDKPLTEKLSKKEFLSGFRKDDKLIPVITLTILFSADEWDGVTTLHEMLDIPDRSLLKYIPNYKLNLVVPGSMSDNEIVSMFSEISSIFLFIKYSKNKQELKDMLARNYDRFSSIDNETARAISILTDSKIKFQEREEKTNMCEAIKQMIEEGKEEGIQLGIQQKTNNIIVNMLTNKKLPVAEVASLVQESELYVIKVAKENGININGLNDTGLKRMR